MNTTYIVVDIVATSITGIDENNTDWFASFIGDIFDAGIDYIFAFVLSTICKNKDCC